VQIRALQTHKAPLAIIAPGRCYRHEATDATHDFMFMQLEGLVVDTGISMSNLLATLQELVDNLFHKKKITMRIRPSFFPFVEPGIEVDIECPFCTQGCSTCKKSKWIEICGAGMVHPTVLENVGIDSTTYTGFAFGFGLTRLAMLLYHINDIRLLHSNQYDFLKQF
jgi:phenylalanyl-tRNA synthetase alpha chain